MHIMDWFLRLEPTPVIPCLALHSVSLDLETLTAVQKYLRSLHQGLRKLEVSFEAPYLHSFSTDSIDVLFDIGSNKELREFTIAMTEIPPSLERTFAKQLLSTITSKQLQEVTLEQITIDDYPDSSRDWFEVDEVLASLSSTTTRIHILTDSSPSMVSSAFPQCAQLGLLVW
ncbi:hypothetical protein BDQ17DRAFT_1364810 [Cyathus striatus]|nr:hypothetical protein BDQ17DRAFT_1364810 [Cyathus striatus]